MKEIKAGNRDKAIEDILNECTPALNKSVETVKKLDELTDELDRRDVASTIICAIVGLAGIAVCLIFALVLTKKTSKRVLETILEPLRAIEDVAKELTEGNLHSNLEYHSDDEIGRLAHNIRKSTRIL